MVFARIEKCEKWKNAQKKKKIAIIIAKFAIMWEMPKTINAKNVINNVIGEILFIAINHNARNVRNSCIYCARNRENFSLFFLYHIYRNFLHFFMREIFLQCKKCEKCDMWEMKNAINFAIREILYITIDRNARKMWEMR